MESTLSFPLRMFLWERVFLSFCSHSVAGPIALARKYLEDEDVFFVFNRWLCVAWGHI